MSTDASLGRRFFHRKRGRGIREIRGPKSTVSAPFLPHSPLGKLDPFLTNFPDFWNNRYLLSIFAAFFAGRFWGSAASMNEEEAS